MIFITKTVSPVTRYIHDIDMLLPIKQAATPVDAVATVPIERKKYCVLYFYV